MAKDPPPSPIALWIIKYGHYHAWILLTVGGLIGIFLGFAIGFVFTGSLLGLATGWFLGFCLDLYRQELEAKHGFWIDGKLNEYNKIKDNTHDHQR